ncbi:MAG: insulinase family protein [Clostridia bacterium]|nr:insulinase family protein [Clostridia bacterium]
MNREILERSFAGDGIGLNFVENDRYKTNYISIYFVTELNKKSASYNTLLARVLTRGCEKYPTQRELNRALDSCFDAGLFSDTAKVGEWHALSLSLCLLDDSFALEGEHVTEKGIELLREVLLHPYLPGGNFDKNYVESERRLNLDEIAAAVNHKARYARSRMFEHMCRLEPYSTCPLGDKRELRAITPESLTEYYRSLLATARIEVFFVGRFDRERVKKEIEEMFSSLVRSPKELPAISVRTKARNVKEVTETMDITQANLVMGFRIGCTLQDPAWRAMSLYNAVLGGSLTSKLFCVLREKMSLCYSISSSPDALKGVMLIYAGIAPENRSVAIREALNQMNEIREGNVTREELESARGALINSLNGLEDNPAALAEWYLPRVLLGCIQTPEAIVEELKRVSLEDVVKASERITLDTVYTLTAKEVQA